MGFKALAAAAALLVMTVGATQAQTILDGSSVEDILSIAKDYGDAELASSSGEDPRIAGTIEDVTYSVFFHNCTDGEKCEDIRFYAGFADNKPTLDFINAWNRDKRFGKAYLDNELDAVIEFDVNLEYGVTKRNMDAAFSVWKLILGQYATYIGFK